MQNTAVLMPPHLRNDTSTANPGNRQGFQRHAFLVPTWHSLMECLFRIAHHDSLQLTQHAAV
jgi:hypothetical protein